MKLRPYIMVTRPPLVVLSIVASLALMIHYQTYDTLSKAIAMLVSVVFVNISLNIANELSDIHIDSLAKPYKPLVSYTSPKSIILVSKIVCIATMILGVVALIYLLKYDIMYGIIGIVALWTGIIYNIFNRRDIFGNIALGTTYGSAAYFCSYPHGLLFAVSFAVLTVAFNIMTQIQDVAPDTKYNRVTIPNTIGVKNAKSLSTLLVIFFITLIVFTDIPIVSRITFLIASLLIFLSRPEYMSTEIYVRICGRLSMLVGFIFLLLGW